MKCMVSIKYTCINSIVIVSAEKAGNIHLLVAKNLSRCIICILKVKYTEFKVSYFTTFSSA